MTQDGNLYPFRYYNGSYYYIRINYLYFYPNILQIKNGYGEYNESDDDRFLNHNSLRLFNNKSTGLDVMGKYEKHLNGIWQTNIDTNQLFISINSKCNYDGNDYGSSCNAISVLNFGSSMSYSTSQKQLYGT